jgi:dynein heavy chain
MDLCISFIFRYLNTYKKYQDLFNNKAEIDVATFLEEQLIALLSFSKRINFYQNLASEISSLYLTVPLNMFCLNCHEVNAELAQRAIKLANKLILHIVDGNRETNRG